MKIQIKILNKEFYKVEKLGGSYYDTPSYQTFGSAAVDLICTEDVTIYPGETKKIHTGLAIWIGSISNALSYAGLILPRSGLGSKGLVLANTIGLIDEDYQGELIVNVWNRNDSLDKDIELKAGDRFAQLMFVPIIKAEWDIVEDFNLNTQRGSLGFGSTDD